MVTRRETGGVQIGDGDWGGYFSDEHQVFYVTVEYCTPETITILYVNYSENKIKNLIKKIPPTPPSAPDMTHEKGKKLTSWK